MVQRRTPKRLRDYPLHAWMEAADACPTCGGPHMVNVTWVDESGDFGDVLVKAHHREDCPEVLEIGPYGPDMGESWDRHDVAGWEYVDEAVTFAGREWTPLKSRTNVALCLNCEELVVGIPIVLFLDSGRRGELDFCDECARELGILDLLVRGG